MSHDLRSPMNAIIGYTRLLQRRLSDRMGEREARNLTNIATSSGNLLNLLNLLNDILDVSRIEAGRIEVVPQQVDVGSLSDECADALESIVKEGVGLRRELEEVGEIQTDADRLRQGHWAGTGHRQKDRSSSPSVLLNPCGTAWITPCAAPWTWSTRCR